MIVVEGDGIMDMDTSETIEELGKKMAAALASGDAVEGYHIKRLLEEKKIWQEYKKQADALTNGDELEKLLYETKRKLEKGGYIPAETAEGMEEAMQAVLASGDAVRADRERARQQPHILKIEHEKRMKALEAVTGKADISPEKIQTKEGHMKNNSNIKYQIFVSSTYDDLKEERVSVIWEILKLENIPVGMENFSASNDRGWDTIQKTIDNSDIYILLLAGRYGSIDDETELSWTETEYNYAKEKGIPILAFIREDDSITKTNLDKGDKEEKLDLFKNKVRGSKGHLTENWKDQHDLAAKVIQAFQKQIKKFRDDPEDSHGWYRVSSSLSRNGNLTDVDKPLSQKQQDMIMFLSRLVNNHHQRWWFEWRPLKEAIL
jgi:hypothetical protein